MKYLTIFEEFRIRQFNRIKKFRSLGDESNASWYPGAGLGKVTGRIEEQSAKGLKKSLNKVMWNILHKFNMTGSKVSYLNAGSYGMAFMVDDDKVIKITSDAGEAMIAKSLVDRRIPKCVKYYGVTKLETKKVDYKLYAILMQRADPLSQEEEDLLQDLDDYFNREEFKFEKGAFKKIAKNHNITIENVKEYAQKLYGIYKSFKKHNISTQDLHTGNMGYVGDTLVHFDIMGNTSESDLSKISKL